jgi:hypothetical protein
VFDDAYEHEVWNLTEEERVLLLVDFWHVSASNRKGGTGALFRGAMGRLKVWAGSPFVSMQPLSIDACQLGGCGFWKRMAGKGKEGGGREERREGPGKCLQPS